MADNHPRYVMNMFKSLSLLALGALTLATATAEPLMVGQKAPEFKVAKWVKGESFTQFKKDQVYVVEFWATWCGPCKVTMPHLSKLSQKYKEKVKIVGVNAWEVAEPKDDSYFGDVEKFVSEQGKTMDYNVVIDGPAEFMSKNWMEAAEQYGIPTAFVVDQNGMVAWIGHPMEMDQPLDDIINKKYDLKTAAEKYKNEYDAQKLLEGVMKSVQEAVEAGDYAAASDAIEKAVAKNHSVLPLLATTNVELQLMFDEKLAFQTLAKYADDKTLESDAMVLNELAWRMVDPADPLNTPDYNVAVKLAQKAVKASNSEDENILDTLGLAYFKAGKKELAIQTQEKAVALAIKKEVDDATIKEFEDRLKMFKASK